MAPEYSVDLCNKLSEKFRAARLYRPQRVARYDEGTELVYEVADVSGADKAQVGLLVEEFVGGGFAGQVYRVKVLEIASQRPVDGIEVGGVYAMKILVPPSGFSQLFRNVLYRLGFQGPFQLQCNPVAARAGAIWQKFIRRAAKIRFGDENTVVDIHATFIDHNLGSCSELSEWVDGRTWRLEVDDHLDLLKAWQKGRDVDHEQLGSAEYRGKRQFMAEFVKLLHDMGAHEFARQYKWSTCKSQPNCLKRAGTEDDPQSGLVAVDFRAGLALLPFLPMSPGDFKLIFDGMKRGSIVQFDRGDVNKLEQFIEEHSDEFSDMRKMLDELKACEDIYRDSVPDITHNHIRLLYDAGLWRTMLSSAVTGWKVRNIIDEQHEKKLRASNFKILLFFVIGLIPFLGKLLRRIWAHADWRAHYTAMLTDRDYFKCAIDARIAEKVITWHRAGRVDERRAVKVAESLFIFLCHLPFSILPAGLHRFLTDKDFRKDKLVYIFIRPFRLYFNAKLREQWLRQIVTEGQKKHILSDEDAQTILSQLDEPFIQKYLISLVVHLLTLPVTQIVSVIVAAAYWMKHPGLPFWEAMTRVGFILFIFQVTPISPGSLVRGFYVLYLVKRERNFKDYNIAVFLAFFKYIGYLAFPIQMAYHYPAMARFMAGHWATDATHIVPVFGERGALLEHWVFCLFYNWPLTIRRRMRKRVKLRALMKPRYWHVGLCTVFAAAIFGFVDNHYLANIGRLPTFKEILWLAGTVPLVCGAAITLGCGGAVLAKRIVISATSGLVTGLLYTFVPAILNSVVVFEAGEIRNYWALLVFAFAVLATIGALAAELTLPDPDLR